MTFKKTGLDQSQGINTPSTQAHSTPPSLHIIDLLISLPLLMNEYPVRIVAAMLDIRPTKLRIIKLIALLFISMHLFACIFWKVWLSQLPLQCKLSKQGPSLSFSSDSPTTIYLQPRCFWGSLVLVLALPSCAPLRPFHHPVYSPYQAPESLFEHKRG